MQNHDEEDNLEVGKPSEVEDWSNFEDDDIMQQKSAIMADGADKIPFVGEKV